MSIEEISADSNLPEHFEEPVNRFLHVPIASRLVSLLQRTPVTPNQVTYVSVFCGLAASLAFSLGTTAGTMAGGGLLEFYLILDCVDGQLARAKNLASDWGRLIDGAAGYIAILAVVIGLAHGYPELKVTLIWLTLLTVLRAMAFDFFKQFIKTLHREGVDWSAMELTKVREQNHSRGHWLLLIYICYLRFQRFLCLGQWALPGGGPDSFYWTGERRSRFFQAHRQSLGCWKWNGPDVVFFALALTSLLGILEACLGVITLLVGLQMVHMVWLGYKGRRHETTA